MLEPHYQQPRLKADILTVALGPRTAWKISSQFLGQLRNSPARYPSPEGVMCSG
ncbi:hypothetical protein DPMN_104300 [Dreissena polymorpha]|uniref:Uncharacterized protein n=1 Tax=Dreissena polymorpha TaxID=45954 RepID=A0A9D4H9P2_DREPO|nr:hypothetical protein DPMN_104300 [Dreissena polymorpha]